MRSGSLDEALAKRLLERAERRPAEGRQALASATRLREELHHVFAAVASGLRPTASSADALRWAELEALEGAELVFH